MTGCVSTTFPDRTLCRCHLPQIPGLAQSLTVWLGHATLPQGPWGRRLPSDRAEPSTQQAESADVRPRERGRFTAARGPVAKAALAGGGQSLHSSRRWPSGQAQNRGSGQLVDKTASTMNIKSAFRRERLFLPFCSERRGISSMRDGGDEPGHGFGGRNTRPH